MPGNPAAPCGAYRLINYSVQHAGDSFIVLTEPGILHVMKQRSAGSVFYDVPGVSDGACVSCNTCPYMKLNTLEKIYQCMRDCSPVIDLSADLIARARKPLDRMLEMSKAVGRS
jgi:quinolinate synthase